MQLVKRREFFWFSAIILLFLFLGSSDLWTQEWRWADIVWRMKTSHDYFHPNLAGKAYYDKPLLSYWLMLITTKFTGLNEWGLRLPNALAGLLSLFCIIQMGKRIYSSPVAYFAGWMLLTSYFFVFWSRVASSDMLNVAGVLSALAWYYTKKENLTFFNYIIFFFILAIACLLKGPVALVLVALVILPDLILTLSWKQQINFRFFIAMMAGIVIYFIPFFLAHQGEGEESSLYLVYRENILRFFSPFDHKDPWYSYFIYLPLYLLPWLFVMIPAVIKNYQNKKIIFSSAAERAFSYSLVLIFLFFTLSGSRRSYYILPLVPFVILWGANQIQLSSIEKYKHYFITIFYGLLFFWFGLLRPLYYHFRGVQPFAASVKSAAVALAPWPTWHVITIGADDRIGFYLQPMAPSLSYRSLPDEKERKAWGSGPLLIVTHPNFAPDLRKLRPALLVIDPKSNH